MKLHSEDILHLNGQLQLVLFIFFDTALQCQQMMKITFNMGIQLDYNDRAICLPIKSPSSASTGGGAYFFFGDILVTVWIV